eukprot:scaffold45149_cov63-Phaeocystis_antarctica.AAC.3
MNVLVTWLKTLIWVAAEQSPAATRGARSVCRSHIGCAICVLHRACSAVPTRRLSPFLPSTRMSQGSDSSTGCRIALPFAVSGCTTTDGRQRHHSY